MPTTARSWNSAQVGGTDVRAGAPDPGDDRVEHVLDARPLRIEVHPGGRDALAEESLAGPLEGRVVRGPERGPRGPTPSRSSPCRSGRRCRDADRRATRTCPANHEPIITLDAPAASASATSRGCRTPPSAQTCLPSSRALVAHSRTAENCGRPTAVCIRVVHMAPGPTPTFTMSAPAATRSLTPSAVTTLPGDDRHLRLRGRGPCVSTSSIRSWCPCAVSITSTSMPTSSRAFAFCSASPLIPMAAATRSFPAASTAGSYRVARSARCRVRMPTIVAVGVDDRRQPVPAVVQQVERLLGVDPGRQRQQFARHDPVQLGEPVDALAVRVGHHTDRTAVVDHDHGAVTALRQQVQRLADGPGRRHHQRGVVIGVPFLDPGRPPRRRRRPGCPAGSPPARHSARSSRPSAAPTPRSCWPRRSGSRYRCRHRWTGPRRAATRPPDRFGTRNTSLKVRSPAGSRSW